MNALEQARTLLEGQVLAWTEPETDRLDAEVSPENLLAAVTALANPTWGYLVAITGLDGGAEAGTMQVLYHFCSGPHVLTLRVTLPRNRPMISSVCGVIPYGSVFERELAEMFGIDVRHAPDASRLFLPDDWPEAVYPLRKDTRLD
ncbi:MAG: hypothetical protein CL610_10230 [Anaerolineaceae bacterium]|nr:hypothetical protein [Anaerolineaceae bacterium]